MSAPTFTPFEVALGLAYLDCPSWEWTETLGAVLAEVLGGEERRDDLMDALIDLHPRRPVALTSDSSSRAFRELTGGTE